MRIFFSADVHGATEVWKKWIRAPEIYGVDILMLCGDLTGKSLVPIIAQSNGKYRVFYFGQNLTLSTVKEVAEIEKKLSNAGVYTCRCDEQKVEQLQKGLEAVSTLIKDKIKQRMVEWLDFLVEKVDTKRIKVIVMPGNDDDFIIDLVIQSYANRGVTWCLNRVVEIDGIKMISLAYTNPTPWNTAREVSEKELAREIKELVRKLHDPHKAIFNFHCPPYGTRIDLAPKLDKSMKPITGPGGVEYFHAGSKAVRKAIEKYQPMLGLHGHIHESPGVEKIGNTVCINPGSEYGEGILRGYIIEIINGEPASYWKVEG